MVIPVLKVLTPEGPTVKSMSEAVLVALGDTAAARGSAAVKTNRIALFLRECRVELILFDEFHHFCDSRAPERRRVTDWLKNLLNECGKPVVLLGLPRAISALYSNEQLRRRCLRGVRALASGCLRGLGMELLLNCCWTSQLVP